MRDRKWIYHLYYLGPKVVGAEGFELDLRPPTKTRIFCDLGP